MDGDSSQPSTASSQRSRRDTALCLTTNQPSTSSARKNSLRRARENTRVRRTNVSADPECGDFAGDERAATIAERRKLERHRCAPESHAIARALASHRAAGFLQAE